jgi:ribosomal protein S18 acetylase RimI-like enzyme
MPEIEIRPVVRTDIEKILAFDHSYTSDHVLQMDLLNDTGQIGARFRDVRLPRSVRVEYPRSTGALTKDWEQRSGILVAALSKEPVGYVILKEDAAPLTTWITDLVVAPRLRRQGIGSALVLAAEEWTVEHGKTRRLVLEMQPKNYPAVRMAEKLGFDFCGYNDHYYANNDIALFYSKWVV